MVSGEGAVELGRRGLRVMDPGRALVGLGSVLGGGGGSVVVADVEWDRFVPAFTSRRASPLLTTLPHLTGSDVTEKQATEDARAVLTARLSHRPEKERLRELRELVRKRAGMVLGRSESSALDLDRPFNDMGFDSLTAVELRHQLHAETGLRLPSTLVFDHPSPRHLADHLHDELFGRPDHPHAESGTPLRSGRGDESSFRDALATIPFSRWEESGLLAAVLSLANSGPTGRASDGAASSGSTAYGTARLTGTLEQSQNDDESAPGTPGTPGMPGTPGKSVEIGAMDVDALVQLALGDSTS
jgi:hypothetical protein